MPVELILFSRYVLGQITNNLIYTISREEIADYEDTVVEYCKKTNFSVMLDAMTQVQDATATVGPLISTALAKTKMSEELKYALSTSKDWPVVVSESTLSVKGVKYPCDAYRAMAYYVLYHPVDDIVESVLPTVAPPLSSGDDVYKFVGSKISGTIIQSRAALIRGSVDILSSE